MRVAGGRRPPELDANQVRRVPAGTHEGRKWDFEFGSAAVPPRRRRCCEVAANKAQTFRRPCRDALQMVRRIPGAAGPRCITQVDRTVQRGGNRRISNKEY